MGTPDFAVKSLKNIINAEHDICGVFTMPDRPKGRGYKLTFTPVKEEALKYNLNVYQPEKIKTEETFELIRKLNPEIIIVVAYGKILPKQIIDYPKYGCINVHGSLLPKYRGAAPIQWAVINGEKTTGITTMCMDIGLDTGDILLKSEVDILENETSGELYDRLSVIGAELVVETIEKIKHNKIKRIKQNNKEATYCTMLDKSMALIDWNKSALDINNLVRGLNPWPICTTTLNGVNFKIHKTKISERGGNFPGEIISLNPFLVCCGNKESVEILEVQYTGKRKMKSEDFLRGYKLNIGNKLGG